MYTVLALADPLYMLVATAGYDKYGYDKYGYNKDGYHREGYHKEGYKGGYDKYGYDYQGYNKDSYDKYGYDKYGEYTGHLGQSGLGLSVHEGRINHSATGCKTDHSKGHLSSDCPENFLREHTMCYRTYLFTAQPDFACKVSTR
jgi:hypothetical protein